MKFQFKQDLLSQVLPASLACCLSCFLHSSLMPSISFECCVLLGDSGCVASSLNPWYLAWFLAQSERLIKSSQRTNETRIGSWMQCDRYSHVFPHEEYSGVRKQTQLRIKFFDKVLNFLVCILLLPGHPEDFSPFVLVRDAEWSQSSFCREETCGGMNVANPRKTIDIPEKAPGSSKEGSSLRSARSLLKHARSTEAISTF